MAVNLFDANFYREFNPDLRGLNDAQAFQHLLNFGLNEGRVFSPYVDLNLYRTNNPDLGAAGLVTNRQLFDHLSGLGAAEGRTFSFLFNANFYRAVNPDLAAAGLNNEQLFEHYVFNGIREGRIAAPGGSPVTTRPSFLSTSSGQIGTIDRLTGEFTEIAVGPFFTDIALSNDGRLFGITYDDLYSINPTTGLSSRIGSLGVSGGFNALGFSGDNRLFAAAVELSSIYTIDTLTGMASPVSSIVNLDFRSSGDIAFDPSSNRFFAVSEETGTEVLFSIGLDGTTTRIGDIGFREIFGLDFENGTLFGYSSDGQQITINPVTGSGTFSQNITGIDGYIAGAA